MSKKINKVGMVKNGDVLYIETCYGPFKAIARKVLFPGQDKEEIVIHKGRNHYFIMSMLLDGSSWVKQAWIANDSDCKGVKFYQKGNVPNL